MKIVLYFQYENLDVFGIQAINLICFEIIVGILNF
jgi:hypothetical protein